MKLTGDISIIKYDNGIKQEVSDTVIREYALTIILDGEQFITLLCTPSGLDNLVMGFLLSESVIKSKADIISLRVDEEKGIAEVTTEGSGIIGRKLHGKRTMTTGCGKGSIFYNAVDSVSLSRVSGALWVEAQTVLELMKEFNKRSELFLSTGGAHSVALAGAEGIMLFHEDVGRHNAMDKIIGEAAQKDISLEDKMVLTSGRISSEMLLKAAKAQLPIIISRSAPTDMAVEMAEKLGVTIIGFARGLRMNVYSSPERIKL